MEYKNHSEMSGMVEVSLKPVRFFPLTGLIVEGENGAVGLLRRLQEGETTCPLGAHDASR
jgi:hypothetical protein